MLIVTLLLASGCHVTRRVLRRDAASRVVALFGPAWHGQTGPFRVVGASLEGTRAVAQLHAPGRDAYLALEPAPLGARDLPPSARAADDSMPGRLAFYDRRPDRDVAITVRCVPACDAASTSALRGLAAAMLDRYAGGIFATTTSIVAGRERSIAWRLSEVAWLLFLLPLGWALARRRSAERLDLLAAGGAALATFVCALVLSRAAPANWYADLLPAAGWNTALREANGVAGFLAQGTLRAVLGWSPRVLFGLNLVAGSLAAAFAYFLFRALSVERAPALLALLMLALFPAWHRVVLSDAEHPLVALIFFAGAWAWARAGETRADPALVVAGLGAALLLPLVRVEALLLAAALPLLTLERAGLRRRLALLPAYVLMLGVAAWSVSALFVARFGLPIPSAAELGSRALHLRHADLAAQLFFLPADGPPRWFPLTAAVLAAIGALVLVFRRPWLLARLLLIPIAMQVALGREMNAEGLVGARYFLPLFAFLALIAAHGCLALAEPLQRWRKGRMFPIAAGAAVLLAIGLEASSAAGYRYAFQDEYTFLRRALATVPRNARVFSLAVRDDDRLHNDPDCCLDPGRSPLALAFPDMVFEQLPIEPQPRFPFVTDTNVYYYESALCGVEPTADTERRNPHLAALVRQECALLRTDPRFELVASGEAAPHATWSFFGDQPIPVRLYRLRAR